MGRAARRQQERSTRRQPRQAPSRSIAPTATRLPGTAHAPRRRFGWLRDIRDELRKVTWPTRAETLHLTMVVLVVSALFGALLGAADVALSWVVAQTILR
ncbi:MAG: preprotein translocase subunit SecE [Chloroflexi bacterium]|nr:preprotein translocase subunit SecE [Chloroflexota bacterium]